MASVSVATQSSRRWLRSALIAAAVALCGASAHAATLYDNTALSSYSNFGQPAGGATNIGGNTITRLLADDITFDPTAYAAYGGGPIQINDVRIAVFNNNASTVQFRTRVRFWVNDPSPPGDRPGTFIDGFTFTLPVTLGPNNGPTSTAILLANPSITIPGGVQTIWVGVAFDDADGTAGYATATELNNVGLLVYNPPVVGSSQNLFFISGSAGDFFGVDGPGGGTFSYLSPNVGNFGIALGFVPVPEPSAVLPTAAAAVGLGWLMLRGRFGRRAGAGE
jgi:hypothetical protein